jgi:hypothetical protein
VAINLTLDSPTATADVSGSVPGTITVNGDCSFSLVAALGIIQGFVTENGELAAGIFASDGTSPVLNVFQNQPLSGSVELFKQDTVAIRQFLPQPTNITGYDIVKDLNLLVPKPRWFNAQGNYGSAGATEFYLANFSGVQSSGTLRGVLGSFNSSGIASGSQTGPAGQSLVTTALQNPFTGETRLIGNEPGSSAGALVDSSLKQPASAPLSGPCTLSFYGLPSNPTTDIATPALFEGTIIYTTQFQGSMSGVWLVVDPATGNLTLTSITAPVQASTLQGGFSVDLTTAPTLPGYYLFQTNTDGTVRGINQGQTSPSLPPAPFVTSVFGRPQPAGPYTIGSAPVTYIVRGDSVPCACVTPLLAGQITLAPGGSVTGTTLGPGTASDIQQVDLTGSWTLDANTGVMTLTVSTGIGPAEYSGFLNPNGPTTLIGGGSATGNPRTITLQPSK